MVPALYSNMFYAFLLCLLLILGLRWIARNLQLVDLPDARKRHRGEVPLCGGLAIFAAFTLAGFGFPDGHDVPWRFEAGFVILVLVGLADDLWRLRPVSRLFAETVAAAVIISGIGLPIVLGDFVPGTVWYLPTAITMVFAIVFVVGMANAINMLDGADGVAGASVAAVLAWVALIAFHVGDGPVGHHALVLLAAVLGFLVFNLRHPWRGSASIFLGDAGTTVLGGALATFLLSLSAGADGLSFVALLWLVAVPVTDTLSLMARRTLAGRSPLSSDRWHLHHLMLDKGVPPAALAPIIAGLSALCGGVAYTGIVFGVPDIYLALGLLLPLAAHTGFVLAAQGSLVPLRAGTGERRRYGAVSGNKELAG